ncbi:hypothetical protein PCE1_003032 [Barthelona sp. PCE]
MSVTGAHTTDTNVDFDPIAPNELDKLQQDLRLRIQSGELYKIAELKNVVRRLLRGFTHEARQDFTQLMFLDEYVRTVSLYKNMTVDTALEGFLERLNPSIDNFLRSLHQIDGETQSTQAKFRALVRSMHLAVLQLFNVAEELRNERLELIQIMLGYLEVNGEVFSQEELNRFNSEDLKVSDGTLKKLNF